MDMYIYSRDKESWFPPERLVVMPWQIYRRVLSGNLQATMIGHAKYRPERYRELVQGEGLASLESLNYDGFPLVVNPRMLAVACSTLNAPEIAYRETNPVATDSTWNLKHHRFLQSYEGRPFYYKIFTIRGEHIPQGHLDSYRTAFEIQIRDRGVGDPQYGGQMSIARTEEEMTHELNQHFSQKEIPTMILILKEKNQNVYSTFKYLCDRKYGYPSIVITEKPNIRVGEKGKKFLNKAGLPQYFGNVMMKANLKTGGLNHSAKGVEMYLKDTLILGADVTHPGPGALIGTPSIAAIVGSVENRGGKFLGSLRLQSKENKEVSYIDRQSCWILLT